MKLKYSKDTGKYLRPVNYAEVFGTITDVTLALINSCTYVYKDKGGTYRYEAVRYDTQGNVYFSKVYC